MDRVIKEVEQANLRIIDKVSGLQAQYRENIQDYKKLDTIINPRYHTFYWDGLE